MRSLRAESLAEETIRNYVLKDAPLGIYDPAHPRRMRVAVRSFEIELLEIDDDGMAHAAGPIVLSAPAGELELFLRISVPIVFDGARCFVPDGSSVRAAYVFETDHPNGACRETAALANA